MSRLGALSASAMRAAKTSSYWIARLVNAGAAQQLADWVVTDSAGYVYGYTYTNNRLSKYDSTGVKQWEYTLTGISSGARLVIDSSNNLIIAGNSGSTAGVVAKINTSGSVQWSKSYSGTSSFSGLAVDSSNNIYLGATNKIIVLDSSGSVSWAKNLPFTPRSIAYYGGNIVFSGGSGATSNYWKMDTSGAIVWQSQDTSATESIDNIKADSSGDYIMTGSITISSVVYPLLLKISSSGSITWQYSLSTSGGSNPNNNIDTDSSNNIYWIASTATTSMLAKLNSSASISWQNSINQRALSASGISLQSSLNVYVGLQQLYKLPTNGTKTGTYAFSSPTTSITYSSSSYSLNSTSISLSTTTSTITSATITLGSPGVAATAGTFTAQKITL